MERYYEEGGDSECPPSDILANIDTVCARFKTALGVGEHPSIDVYLREVPERWCLVLLRELTFYELLHRLRNGDVPRLSEYQQRFPDHLKLMADVFREAQHRYNPRGNLDANGVAPTANYYTDRILVSGDRLGDRYEIRSEIGRGGMGTVYKAYDRLLDRNIALKIPHKIRDEVVRKRFLREAKIATAIRHVNVCPIYDAGESGGTLYMSMELIRGVSLESTRKERPLSAEDALELTYKLALAVHEVHQAGIVHRDFKPSNVMIRESGEPLLMDFGLARAINEEGSQLTSTGAVVGTPAYMAPEQILASRHVDRRTDIWSIGVLLYLLLTDELPFIGSVGELLSSIPYANPPEIHSLRPDLDPRLEQLCSKAMRKSPDDRFQSGQEMADAIQSYLTTPAASEANEPRSRQVSWITIPIGSDGPALKGDGENVVWYEFDLAMGEAIVISDELQVIVVEIRGEKCRLGIEAPSDRAVHRGELFEQMKRNKREK